jgi:hypothetical protein
MWRVEWGFMSVGDEGVDERREREEGKRGRESALFALGGRLESVGKVS